MQHDDVWRIDVILIEKGSFYDGYFEKMADMIKERLSPEIKNAILPMKHETPDDEEIHGVEYYEAIIADGVRTLPELREWLKIRRAKPFYYWLSE